MYVHNYVHRSCPKGTFTAKLKADHAHFISQHWNYFKPVDRLQYLKYVFQNFISVGIFLESNPYQPVSWAFQSNFGSMNATYTLEEHRRKSYNRMATLCLMEKILKDGMMPIAGVNIQNTPSFKLAGKIGLVEAFDTTWMLYSKN